MDCSSPLRPLASARFQVLFTLLRAVLFTFPSRYLFTIGLLRVFSLGRWCCRIQTGLLLPRLTQVPARCWISFRLRVSHPLWTAFPCSSAKKSRSLLLQALQPQPRPYDRAGLGSFPFARHYLGNHYLFSPPRGT
jgi:hypothetical protein